MKRRKGFKLEARFLIEEVGSMMLNIGFSRMVEKYKLARAKIFGIECFPAKIKNRRSSVTLDCNSQKEGNIIGV